MRMRPASEPTYWYETDTAVGRLLLAGAAQALRRVHFQSGPHPMRAAPEWREDATPFARVLAQLGEYFSGTRRAFTLRLAPEGTAFQLAVWEALRAIPYGQTVSYGELARRLGNAGGARAGADGSLTGFGGGLFIKRALLSLEGAACVADLFSAHESARAANGVPAPD